MDNAVGSNIRDEKETWARANPDKMTPNEYATAWQDVQAQHIDGNQPQAHPKAIVLAGQPGAGKSALTREAMKELGDRGGAVTIDVDQLREYHPRYSELAAIIHETGLLGSIAWPVRGKVAFWRTRPLPAERGGISG